MGTNPSKTQQRRDSSPKPKSMPYKRQFSSDEARISQQTMYKDFRQNTLDIEDKKLVSLSEQEKAEANKPSQSQTSSTGSSSNHVPNIKKPDILDPKKYKPPPSPAVNENVLPTSEYVAFLEIAKSQKSHIYY